MSRELIGVGYQTKPGVGNLPPDFQSLVDNKTSYVTYSLCYLKIVSVDVLSFEQYSWN